MHHGMPAKVPLMPVQPALAAGPGPGEPPLDPTAAERQTGPGSIGFRLAWLPANECEHGGLVLLHGLLPSRQDVVLF